MSDKIAKNSAGKALNVVAEIILCDGNRTLREIAHSLDMTVPTVYRLVAAMQDCGFLTRMRRGSYVPGPTLQLIADHCSKREMVRKIARPILARLSAKLGGVCHMGTWDENMVTYIIKSSQDEKALFTKESMQLEGYCSGLGKSLLSTLDNDSIESYLNDGDFSCFTENTIIDPDKLRDEIYDVRGKQYALDKREFKDDLFCVAIPIESDVLKLPLAISVSRENVSTNYWPDLDQDLRELRLAGNLIISMVNAVVAQR